MDVLRLDRDTFYADALVEGYDSLIWTERYLEPGEFEIKTPNIAQTIEIIPEGSLITLRDTREVMFVETHIVTKNADGLAELTTKGRSFETFLENRTMSGLGSEPFRMQLKYRSYEAAVVYLYQNLCHSGNYEVTRSSYGNDSRTKVPRLLISEGHVVSEAREYYYITPGYVYSQMIEFLSGGGYGIRTLKPDDGSASDTVSVSNAGSISLAYKPYNSYLQVHVYKGQDRSLDQTTNNVVIFDYQSGHIETPKYLFSVKDFKTQATLMLEGTVINYYSGTTGKADDAFEFEGLDKRMLWIDGGVTPPGNTSDWYPAMRQKTEFEFKKYQKRLMFDGEISINIPYEYKVDYDLGDTISLVAEYGVNQPMVVSEYIRTEDIDGDRGYPTLILPY